MDINAYREEIKLALTGGLLDLEIEDSVIDRIINSAFREIQRYIDTTVIRTIPFSRCIDLGEITAQMQRDILPLTLCMRNNGSYYQVQAI